MRIAIILNGISLNKEKFHRTVVPVLARDYHVDVFETQSKNDAASLAAKAVQRRYNILIAAGGDGTLHQVLNGMLQGNESAVNMPVLGIVPWGSGNDFARTLNLHRADPHRLLRAIQENKYKNIDVGEVEYSPYSGQASIEKRYFLNVVDTGMGPVVVKKVLDSGRAFGSAVAYYRSILSTFFTYKSVVLHAKSAEWEWHSAMRTFAVGNGKYYGNGLCICPDAKLDDDRLEVFACGGVTVMDFILQSLPLKQGKRINHPEITYMTTKEVHLWADEPLEIEADGEIIGMLPATVRLSGTKIVMLLG